jgi:RNA-directed DNA polymerase
MWSPQHYIDDGIAKGLDRGLLERAVSQIENIISTDPDRPALLTLRHLAERASVNYLTLRSLVASSRIQAYRFFRIRKRTGGHRLISVPNADLIKVQRWIAAYVLNPLPVHHCSFAFKPTSSIYRAAMQHCGARWLVKMDVSGFFGSISEIQVYRVFWELRYQPLIAFELARLTTHALPGSARYKSDVWQARRHSSPISEYTLPYVGFLPQGAPTSPMLSNLVMRDTDAAIEAIARAAGVRYTRYSDDLTFSTRAEFGRSQAAALIANVTRALVPVGLRPNTRKTVVVPPGGRKVVLGLLVDGARPKLSREFRSLLRQHLYYLERFGPAAHAAARGFDTISGMYRHIRGKIDFANMVDQDFAVPLKARLEKISWSPKIDEEATD